MSEETTNQQSCGGKKRAMLAYGLVQISATVVSAVSLAAIAVGLCAVKQESRLFNGCVETVVAEGRSQAEACLLYTSPSPRDLSTSRMPSSA